MGEHAGEDFANALQINWTITSLWYSGNNFRDDTTKMLEEQLQTNNTSDGPVFQQKKQTAVIARDSIAKLQAEIENLQRLLTEQQTRHDKEQLQQQAQTTHNS
eukprot:TRINITY_DN3223_c0_g1_i1.p1 TRINITY_DN3223_c0_g1~~TRINITY_DN3223_c0_g1_i1.p1  ORF type:complete len:103 (-),score=26.74 TRINITY_DN3223_c0_g1_i1:71-379(-)